MARIWNKHKTNTPLKRKVFVGMSGGVDSSVAAGLLKKQGYDVVGIHLKCWNVDGCAEQDAEDARRAAETLGIPFYVLDFEKEYKEKVVEYMVDGYRRGITPNPDVECNREIKFGLFLKKALEMGADYVATGHYVRLRERKNDFPSTRFAHPAARVLVLGASPLGRAQRQRADHAEAATRVLGETTFSLLTARDGNKDQSYFLWTLTQDQLKHCLFPIGEYTKPEVRVLARKFGLLNAEKKDSQGICFLGKVTLKDFLADFIPVRRGAVLTTAGEQIGTHDGASFYTIGQRHISIRNRQSQSAKRQGNIQPLYVAEKDVKKNTIVVAEGNEDISLFRKEILLEDVNFINRDLCLAISGVPVYARVRYRQPLAKANLQLITHNLQQKNKETHQLKNPLIVKLIFALPQKFVAPGQSAVFYTKDGEMIGGGIIV